jgi:phospho-N-acetylmuramoyl-pentapeptide-transferase
MIFILETLSVIIQLTSKKFRNGKKVFKIAPFHHHLEACGWAEETVVFRLWLV